MLMNMPHEVAQEFYHISRRSFGRILEESGLTLKIMVIRSTVMNDINRNTGLYLYTEATKLYLHDIYSYNKSDLFMFLTCH